MAQINVETGARVRELRDICGLSAAAVAARLGITAEEYAGYESGASDIPISMLYELAGLFGVDMTDLMTGRSATLHNYAVVRAGHGLEVERYPGYRFESLAHAFRNRMIEPLIVTLDPDENRNMKLVTHPGQEFNLVLEGTMRVILGDETVDLGPGDSIYFDPAIPHGQQCVEGRVARFLTVIVHGAPEARK
ncbi:MAG: cupin domain-containing protein [Clostridia bacterium]|nr:cupin domain-containing protein [Clostridia bacterium]